MDTNVWFITRQNLSHKPKKEKESEIEKLSEKYFEKTFK